MLTAQRCSRSILELAGALLPLLVTTLALSRVLYEGLFPRALWLARPLPVLLFTLGGGALGMLAWWALRRRTALPAGALLPLLLNALILFPPQVDLVRGPLLLAASVWLTAVLIVCQPQGVRKAERERGWDWTGVALVWTALLPIYLLTMPHTVGRADTFEFQVVAPQLGIAHPTGYPLYLLLGKLFTLIPLDSVAWRLNLATAVYGLLAAALIFAAGYRLSRRPVAAVLGAVVWGLTPTQWSQAIEAEVYTLHALLVAAALFVALRLLDAEAAPRSDRAALLLAFLIGLGLTNHLTTVFLLPPAALALVLARRRQGRFFLPGWRTLLKLALACALPLLLYAYLPLRWQAVVGEPMGFGRFVDWVIGGRFQDALQWDAWLNDPTRYAVVGRLFLDNWGWANLGLTLLGLGVLLAQQWRAALLLLVAWLGFTFYALNYYVPDLDVFLTAAHVVLALLWIGGLAGAIDLLTRFVHRRHLQAPLVHAALLLSVTPALLLAVARWATIDRSAEDGLTTWGQAVLAQPLAPGAAILADSEKIAPLYYLQQAEGMRPDLDILVLPDEPAYRAELDARLAAGQPVYLARFLPGLEGVYHLRAAGPLTLVSMTPLTAPPPTAVAADHAFGPLRLLGYDLQAASPYAPRETAVTLYWQAPAPVTEALHVYLRWAGQPPLNPVGQHPAHNYYPTYAWDPGEIVPDFYRLSHPVRAAPHTGVIEVAVAPPFTPTQTLAWQPVAEVALPASGALALARPLRAQLGPTLLSGVQFPAQVRPQSALTVVVSGYGAPPAGTQVNLAGATAVSSGDVGDAAGRAPRAPFATTFELEVGTENGRFPLAITSPNAICGWLRAAQNGCLLGEVEISGVPLPPGAVNFDDQIALLAIDLPDAALTPGGRLRVNLTWQSLAPIAENYTVFVQVLDTQDRLVGQVDAWPLQGTYPTRQWRPGEIINDPHVVLLSGDLPPGDYRLQVGWYLLSTLRRLPVLDAGGAPIDDKVVIPGLTRSP